MAMPESLIRDWERLSEQNQRQARSYIHLLLSQQQDEQERVYPARVFGTLAHRFHGIDEDFDAPLSAFKEYLQ